MPPTRDRGGCELQKEEGIKKGIVGGKRQNERCARTKEIEAPCLLGLREVEISMRLKLWGTRNNFEVKN